MPFDDGWGRSNDSAQWNRDVRQSVGMGRTDNTPKANDANELRAGMRVFHNKFGEGQILRLEGQGNDAKAQVQFGRHGVKWLALSLAKLTPITS